MAKTDAERMRGWVYVAQCDGFYKIGMSYSNVEGRIAAMQTGNPHSVSLVWAIEHMEPKMAEARMHTMFARQRVRGEWFLLDLVSKDALLQEMAKELRYSQQLEREQQVRRIDTETYDVPVVAGDYDADDVRAYTIPVGVAVPGDPAY